MASAADQDSQCGIRRRWRLKARPPIEHAAVTVETALAATRNVLDPTDRLDRLEASRDRFDGGRVLRGNLVGTVDRWLATSLDISIFLRPPDRAGERPGHPAGLHPVCWCAAPAAATVGYLVHALVLPGLATTARRLPAAVRRPAAAGGLQLRATATFQRHPERLPVGAPGRDLGGVDPTPGGRRAAAGEEVRSQVACCASHSPARASCVAARAGASGP